MAALSSFHPYVLPKAPGIPEFAVDRALVDCAAQLCRDTLIWTEDADPVLLVPGTDVYEVYPESRASVIAVLSAEITFEGKRAVLSRLTPRQARQGAGEIGKPVAFCHTQANEIELYPRGLAAGQLDCQVALQPISSAAALPDFLFDEWRETVSAGAISRLLLTMGDVSQAQVADMIYSEGVRRAHARRQTGRQRTPMRTAPIV